MCELVGARVIGPFFVFVFWNRVLLSKAHFILGENSTTFGFRGRVKRHLEHFEVGAAGYSVQVVSKP